jgi:DnaD/phage-associated family protein
MDFNAPYINRRNWILENLESIHMDPQETMVVLLIDYFNEQHIAISDEKLAEKLKLSDQEIEDVLMKLSDKGYLTIDFKDGNVIFDISGIFHEKSEGMVLQKSLIESVEDEFGRPLSSLEMQRIMELASVYDERRVICALNEAVVYDRRNLNYMESILASWMQKGLSIEDVENGKR